MSKVNFTPNQQDCINVSGGNILISAAAGSGKTAVLTERVIRLLTKENPISADKLVIVTFTVAAADEMRQRINQKLSDLIEKDPTNKILQNQQLLLANAKISTIHSLCSSLIKEHFQKLSLPNEFRIADETELEIIKQDAINEVFDKEYENKNKDFLSLVEFTCTKDDKPLALLTLSVYDFIRSFAFPKKFLNDTLNAYKSAKSIKENIWYETISNHVINAIKSIISTLNSAIEDIKSDSVIEQSYLSCYENDKNQFLNIINDLKEGQWDKAVFNVKNIEKERLKSVRNYEDKEFLESIKEKRNQAYKALETIEKKYLLCTEQEFLEDIKVLTLKISTLFDLVIKVYDEIEEKKSQLAVIDYADLEHFTVKLLVKETENGYEKTQTAIELSNSFDEIMIDECQDINEVQNLIFNVLSKDQTNLFMVGDVKQSIYSFRKAMPKLFVEKKLSFPKYNKDTHSNENKACITLEKNFRSRNEVCNTTNFIFSQIMSKDMGEIEYDEGESLVPAAVYPDYEKANAEVHIINYEKDDERESIIVEALYIGNRIKEMIKSNYLVNDKGKMRPCEYKDFAILIRAKKGKADIIAKELKAMNVPCFSDSTEGYFSEYEIMVIINLLKVIDNPLLDICLVSVLMSPMFGFSADLITEIKLCENKAPFYIAVTKKAEEGNLQCINFIDILTKLRQKAVTQNVDELLQDIYDQTDFISLSYALGNGEQKDANLRLLLTYAKQYESIGNNGLSGFLRYIDNVVKNKQDFSCANTISEHSNTVKIMSIHSSKGLEFPICIVADCGKKFNKMDLNKNFQLNSSLYFGMKITDKAMMKSYTNLPFEAIRLKTEQETISEEMRVLYVALTRAKEKLIMVMTLKNANNKIISIASSLTSDKKIAPYDVFSSNSYADWIIASTIRHPSLLSIRKEVGLTNIPILSSDFSLDGYLVDASQIKSSELVEDEKITMASINEDIVSTLENTFSYQYKFDELTKTPAKLTATQIAKQNRITDVNLNVTPKFLQKQGVTPAQRGTILHSFMQFADYNKAQENLDKEIERLVEQEFITKQQALILNRPKIEAFLNSDLYKRMKNANNVLREYKFLHFINAKKINENINDNENQDEILIQGIADCIIFEPDGIILVDYKTDYVNDEEIIINRYYDQLLIYKNAIENAFHLKVKQCIIYALHLEKEIDVKVK